MNLIPSQNASPYVRLMQAPETGRSSAGQQQMQLSKDIAAARLPAGFRAGDAPPVNWDEDAGDQFVGEWQYQTSGYQSVNNTFLLL